jgi:hypothetical protein
MKQVIVYIIYFVGCYAVIDWVNNGIQKWNSYSQMWENNKRQYEHDHYEKESDRD